MRRPDIDRMMESMTAREYKEWEAYERAVGPLDSSYEREMLCEIHELIQLNNILTGASITRKGKKNPAGKFRTVLRPSQLFEPPDDYDEGYEEEPDEDEDDLEDFELEARERRHRDPDEYDPAKDPFAPR